MNLEKMKKTAGRMEKCVRVLQIVVVIVMAASVCLAAVLMISNALHPGVPVMEALHSMDRESAAAELSPEQQWESSRSVYVAVTLILDAVFAAGIWYILRLFCRILQPMKEGNPFCGTVVVCIRKIAWTVIVMGVFFNLANAVSTTWYISNLYTWASEGDFLRAVVRSYTLDADFLVVFAVLMLVSWIFEYGTELQKLSDETL